MIVAAMSTRALYSPTEVGKPLGMSRSTVRRRIAAGELRATKAGNHNRIWLVEGNEVPRR